MPRETCAALDLPADASYADGAAQAMRPQLFQVPPVTREVSAKLFASIATI